MKKAVILTGNNQYLVSEGDTIEVELLHTDDKTLSFEPLLVIEDDNVQIGKPTVNDVKVSAEITTPEVLADKVMSIRYKAKKRVHKVRGHRQHHTVIKITSIK